MNLITITSDSRALVSAQEGGMVRFGKPNKNGDQKIGSFARAIAFASKDERLAAGQSMYAKWLATGNYRPLIADMLSVKLVSKDAADYIERTTLAPFAGKQIPKEKLVELAKYIVEVVRNRVAAGKPEPKGEKAFVLNVCERIATEGEPGPVVSEQ